MILPPVTLYDYVIIQLKKYEIALNEGVTHSYDCQQSSMLQGEDCDDLKSQNVESTKINQTVGLMKSELKDRFKKEVLFKHLIEVDKMMPSVDGQHRAKQSMNNLKLGYLSDLDKVFILFKGKEISCHKLDKRIKSRQLIQAHKIWFYEKCPSIVVKFNSFKGHKINHLYKVCYSHQYKNKYTDEFILKKYWYSSLNYRMSYVLLSGV
jgi:hypothetical protein